MRFEGMDQAPGCLGRWGGFASTSAGSGPTPDAGRASLRIGISSCVLRQRPISRFRSSRIEVMGKRPARGRFQRVRARETGRGWPLSVAQRGWGGAPRLRAQGCPRDRGRGGSAEPTLGQAGHSGARARFIPCRLRRGASDRTPREAPRPRSRSRASPTRPAWGRAAALGRADKGIRGSCASPRLPGRTPTDAGIVSALGSFASGPPTAGRGVGRGPGTTRSRALAQGARTPW